MRATGSSAAGGEQFEQCLVARDAEVCGDRLAPGRVEVGDEPFREFHSVRADLTERTLLESLPRGRSQTTSLCSRIMRSSYLSWCAFMDASDDSWHAIAIRSSSSPKPMNSATRRTAPSSSSFMCSYASSHTFAS